MLHQQHTTTQGSTPPATYTNTWKYSTINIQQHRKYTINIQQHRKYTINIQQHRKYTINIQQHRKYSTINIQHRKYSTINIQHMKVLHQQHTTTHGITPPAAYNNTWKYSTSSIQHRKYSTINIQHRKYSTNIQQHMEVLHHQHTTHGSTPPATYITPQTLHIEHMSMNTCITIARRHIFHS
ncbi:hypothetical protein BsWGS_17495 [Bradybaena similaris]